MVFKPLHAIRRAHDDVLDASAVPAGDVDAGLDGERHARLERLGVTRDDVRVLVRLEPDAVAGAVHEPLAVPGGGDQLSCGGVHRVARGAGAYGLDRARLGVEEDSEVVEEVLRGVANRVGAGAVGAVAVGRGSTDVDDDGIADLDNAFADVMVGACGVRAGPHDDEVSADVTLVEDRLTDVFGDLGLASTGAQELAHTLVHAIDRGAGSPQRVDLGRRLPHP